MGRIAAIFLDLSFVIAVCGLSATTVYKPQVALAEDTCVRRLFGFCVEHKQVSGDNSGPSKTVNKPAPVPDQDSQVIEQDNATWELGPCVRKVKVLSCPLWLTGKYDLGGISIQLSSTKIVDGEGNEYFPNYVKFVSKAVSTGDIKVNVVKGGALLSCSRFSRCSSIN